MRKTKNEGFIFFNKTGVDYSYPCVKFLGMDEVNHLIL